MGVDEWVGRGLVARAGVGPTQVLHLSTVCSTGKDWEERKRERRGGWWTKEWKKY